MKFEVIRNGDRDREGERILDEIAQLRFGVYVNVRLIRPENYPDGRFEDAWDRIAASPHGTLHYIAEEHGLLRSATRIVPYTQAGWSLGDDVDLEGYLAAHGLTRNDITPFCDGSRIISDKHTRPGLPFPRGADDLVYISHKDAFDRGNTHIFTAANPNFAAFRKVNYQELGPITAHQHDAFGPTDVVHPVQPMYMQAEHLRCTPEQLEPLPVASRTYGVFEVIGPNTFRYSDILVDKIKGP